jgi:putative transposase
MKYHLVLVTKYRRKCINKTMLDRLIDLSAMQCEKWDIELIECNGEGDHMHFMLGFHPSIQPSKFINSLKTVTSRLIRLEFSKELSRYHWKPVFWSRAYCLVSAGGAPLETLREYIENQDRPT